MKNDERRTEIDKNNKDKNDRSALDPKIIRFARQREGVPGSFKIYYEAADKDINHENDYSQKGMK